MADADHGPATVQAEALTQAKAQMEAMMAKSRRLTGSTLAADPADIGELTGYHKDRLARGTYQIRGSVVVPRGADVRAQLVAIRNAATSALAALDRGGDPADVRVLVQNHMNGAARQVLEIRRAAGEKWAK
jgi:hypothetical protein